MTAERREFTTLQKMGMVGKWLFITEDVWGNYVFQHCETGKSCSVPVQRLQVWMASVG